MSASLDEDIDRALHVMARALYSFLSPFAWRPTERRPDFAAWGRTIVADYPVSMRRIMALADGHAVFTARVLDADRFNDIGEEMPDIVDDAARAAIWDGIADGLRAPAEPAPCEPSLFADWAMRERRRGLPHQATSKTDEVTGWCALVCELVDDHVLREELGTHATAFAYYQKRRFVIDDILRAARSTVAIVLQQEYALSHEHGLGHVITTLGDNALVVAALDVPREVDRRLLLRASSPAVQRLARTPMWGSLPDDLVERWLVNAGVRFITSDIENYSHEVFAFWQAIADSTRTAQQQRHLFELAVEIAEFHCAIVFFDKHEDASFPRHHATIAEFRSLCSETELAIIKPSPRR